MNTTSQTLLSNNGKKIFFFVKKQTKTSNFTVDILAGASISSTNSPSPLNVNSSASTTNQWTNQQSIILLFKTILLDSCLSSLSLSLFSSSFHFFLHYSSVNIQQRSIKQTNKQKIKNLCRMMEFGYYPHMILELVHLC